MSAKYVSPNGYSDDYGANVADILCRGSRIVRGKIPQQVRADLREAVRDGVLGTMKKDGLKPEIFFHPSKRNEAAMRRQAEHDYAMDCIAGVLHAKSVDDRIADAIVTLAMTATRTPKEQTK